MVTIDGNPWFVAKDLSDVLGFSEANFQYHMKTNMDGSEKLIVSKSSSSSTMGCLFVDRAGRLTLIAESGLYKMAMRSKKPEAKPFQDWVAKVVLPAIRKDGVYIMGEEKVATGELSEDELSSGYTDGIFGCQ